jgi:hypothetical protein
VDQLHDQIEPFTMLLIDEYWIVYRKLPSGHKGGVMKWDRNRVPLQKQRNGLSAGPLGSVLNSDQ